MIREPAAARLYTREGAPSWRSRAGNRMLCLMASEGPDTSDLAAFVRGQTPCIA